MMKIILDIETGIVANQDADVIVGSARRCANVFSRCPTDLLFLKPRVPKEQ